MVILTLATKVDFEQLARDLNRNKNKLHDLDYDIKNLAQKVTDNDNRVMNFEQYVRMDL